MPAPEPVYFVVRHRHGKPEASLEYERLPAKDIQRVYALQLDTLVGYESYLFNPQRGLTALMQTYQQMLALNTLPASNLKK